MKLTTSAFAAGATIPRKFTGDGQDVSPPLAWDDVPPGTQELALICVDPDAPTPQPWVHWLIYGIPAEVQALPENVPPQPHLEQPVRASQGRNSWSSGRTTGYRGPAPPRGHGTHHYHFTLYALDTKLPLEPGATVEQLKRALAGHIVAEANLVGTYER
jgi:Raf kinase inhibitor-like YbhB/YbcL family protein